MRVDSYTRGCMCTWSSHTFSHTHLVPNMSNHPFNLLFICVLVPGMMVTPSLITRLEPLAVFYMSPPHYLHSLSITESCLLFILDFSSSPQPPFYPTSAVLVDAPILPASSLVSRPSFHPYNPASSGIQRELLQYDLFFSFSKLFHGSSVTVG